MAQHTLFGVTEGKNQALFRAIPFCGEYPGPRFEDNFDQPIKRMEFQIAGGGKMGDS